MKDLIFVGGAKGVGKSSVIAELVKETTLPVVNTGDIVLAAMREQRDPESDITTYLIEKHTGIVDTHYAGGYRAGRFPRGLAKERLLCIAASKSIDLILLDLPGNSFFDRRVISKPEKYHDRNIARAELEMNRAYFKQYCEDLLIEGMVIVNIHLHDTVDALRRRIYG